MSDPIDASSKEPAPLPTAPQPCPAAQDLSWWKIAGVIALFVAIGHGWSVNTGLYLDDYAHFEHLRDGNWSYRSAVDAARLGIVGEVLDLWGRQEAGLKFYRPIAFWIMRAEYTAVGWHPVGMHLFSLGWHFACSMLVAAVAVRAFGRRFWGLVAGTLMAIHPAHVGTVYWIACQTELLTTAFLLTGLLAYARQAGWQTPWFARRSVGEEHRRDAGATPADHRRDAGATPSDHRRDRAFARDEPPGRGATPADHQRDAGDTPSGQQGRAWPFGLVAIVCYGLALGCRENAALFPLVCWLGDRLIGASRRRWIRWDHVGMGVMLVAYMGLRWEALGGFPVPPPPYLMPVSASVEFVQYIAYKLVMYVLGLFCFVPVVPVGSRDYFAEHLGIFYGVFGAVVLAGLVLWAVYRFRRSMLWPFVWMGCLIAPIMLVFASPHHLYLPALGMVLPMTGLLVAVAGGLDGGPIRWEKPRAVVCAMLVLLLAGGLGGMAWSMGFAYVRGVLSEDLVVRDVKRQVRPLRDGDHLFFINLPVLAYYAIPSIEQELGYRDLKGHVLVFSPDLIRMESPGEVEILDRHRLRVRAPQDKRYLAGTTGTMLLGVMGIDKKLEQGWSMDAGLFRVTISDMDAEGVRELLFEFDEPIDSPNYHFYLGSPQFMAYELSSQLSAIGSQSSNRSDELSAVSSEPER